MVRADERGRRASRDGRAARRRGGVPVCAASVRLADGVPYSHELLAGPRRSSSLRRCSSAFSSRIGDRVVIGTLPFTVRGVIERVPGNALELQSDAARRWRTTTTSRPPGSRASAAASSYHWLFNVAEGRRARVRARRSDASSEPRGIRGSVDTFHFVENWLTRSLANIDGFLSLIGLAIVVLGGHRHRERDARLRAAAREDGRDPEVPRRAQPTRRSAPIVAQVVALSFVGGLLGLVVAQVHHERTCRAT